jgi:hypothetical protein
MQLEAMKKLKETSSKGEHPANLFNGSALKKTRLA